MKNSKKIHLKQLISHQTKLNVLTKFAIILAIVGVYFGYMTYKYGLQQGISTTILTWSFFVLCTPVADAGFLLDFPLRILTNIRMRTSEIAVWAIAISTNLYTFFFAPELYEKNSLLKLFKHILEAPFPFWSIIILSGIGTFASIYFGDELLDKTKHQDRTEYHKHKYNYRLLLTVFIFIATFIVYDFLLKKLGVSFA